MSTKVCAGPIVDFVSRLRVDEEDGVTEPKKHPLRLPDPKLFSFYQKDVEHWRAKNSESPKPKRLPRARDRSPRDVLDVDIKGNSGTVFRGR